MIREKINAAIQDMPENEEIKQLLSGSCKIHSGRSAGSTNAYLNIQHEEHRPRLAVCMTACKVLSLQTATKRQKFLARLFYARCATVTFELVLLIVSARKAHKC